jgi:hypothetical protein
MCSICAETSRLNVRAVLCPSGVNSTSHDRPSWGRAAARSSLRRGPGRRGRSCPTSGRASTRKSAAC